MHNQQAQPDTEMIERAALERMLPKIRLGPDVTGARFGRRDGPVNPLQLLEALHRAIQHLGGRILYRSSVTGIEPDGAGFRVSGPSGTWQADKVVVAAGLATDRLTRPLGLAMPLRAERGQILVTERLAPMFPYPASGIRQTAEGTVTAGREAGRKTRAFLSADPPRRGAPPARRPDDPQRDTVAVHERRHGIIDP